MCSCKEVRRSRDHKQKRVASLVALEEHATGPVDDRFRESGRPRAEKNPERPIKASPSPEDLARGIPSKFAFSTLINKLLVCYPVGSPVGAISPIARYNDYFGRDDRVGAKTVEECRQFGEVGMNLCAIPCGAV